MNTKKTLFVVIAAMLVAATLSCFAKGNAVTQWKAKVGGDTALFTFYSDKTWEEIATYEDGHSDKIKGTYSGDTTKDGEISLVFDGGTTLTADIVGDLMDFDGAGVVLTKVK